MLNVDRNALLGSLYQTLFIRRRWKPIYSEVDHLSCGNVQQVLEIERRDRSQRSERTEREHLSKKHM